MPCDGDSSSSKCPRSDQRFRPVARHRMRTRTFSKVPMRKLSRGRTPLLFAAKVAVSIRRSEQDAALQVLPGRPRASAHMWGKRARILTEINRLPQVTRRLPRRIAPPNQAPSSALPDRWNPTGPTPSPYRFRRSAGAKRLKESAGCASSTQLGGSPTCR